MSGTGDALENAILQGLDAHPVSSYREDRRAAAAAHSDHSAPNTDDELGSDLPSDDDYANDDEDFTTTSQAPRGTADPVKGLMNSRTATRGEEGATNTGPKGVLRDQQRQAAQETAARSANIHATNKRMESLALNSETYTEQQAREKRELAAQIRRENAESDEEESASREAIADLQAKERRREMRIAELKNFSSARNSALISGSNVPSAAAVAGNTGGGKGDRWFGHLREVDERGYVSAIDNEASDVPVVIHIYSRAVAQCNALTSSLASLARQYPRTKFLQVQAAAIGFGKSTNEDGEEEEEYDEYNSKTLEVLPTVLVYRAGELVANLVRVDLDPMWGRGREQDVRDLLEAYGALAEATGPATGGAVHAGGQDDDE